MESYKNYLSKLSLAYKTDDVGIWIITSSSGVNVACVASAIRGSGKAVF